MWFTVKPCRRSNGGEETQVLESVFNFSIVDRGIYFIPRLNADDPDGNASLEFLDFASNKVETIALLPTPRDQIAFGLAVSPDERSILYNQVDDGSSDLRVSSQGWHVQWETVPPG